MKAKSPEERVPFSTSHVGATWVQPGKVVTEGGVNEDPRLGQGWAGKPQIDHQEGGH